MPLFNITIHLAGGGSASLKEDLRSIGEVEAAIRRELAAPDPELRIVFARALISVKKESVLGFSIDEA